MGLSARNRVRVLYDPGQVIGREAFVTLLFYTEQVLFGEPQLPLILRAFFGPGRGGFRGSGGLAPARSLSGSWTVLQAGGCLRYFVFKVFDYEIAGRVFICAAAFGY